MTKFIDKYESTIVLILILSIPTLSIIRGIIQSSVLL